MKSSLFLVALPTFSMSAWRVAAMVCLGMAQAGLSVACHAKPKVGEQAMVAITSTEAIRIKRR